MPSPGGSGRIITEGLAFLPFGTGATSLVNGASRYLYAGGPSLATAMSQAQRPIARRGTLKNLFVYHGTTGGGAVTYRVYVNGVDTGIIATVNGGGTDASDTTNTYDVVPGDLVALEATSGGVAPSGVHAQLEMERRS